MEKSAPKLEKNSQGSLAIDGAKLKSIREGKNLTQLYVASVVGVTTDTISRWENNRYPSIKKDNALRLCSALEVELPEILRQEEPAPEPEPVAEAQDAEAPRRQAPRVAALLFGILLAGVAVFFAVDYFFPGTPTAVRTTPRCAAPGAVVPLQIKIVRHKGDSGGFLLKETLPPGWRLVRALPSPAAVNPRMREVKWFIPAGTEPISVAYTAELPVDAAMGSKAAVRGEIMRYAAGRNHTEGVDGDSEISVGACHWADRNADSRIDDDEIMPAYYLCEELKGLGLDWKSIEAIWSAKGYRWNPRTGFELLQ